MTILNEARIGWEAIIATDTVVVKDVPTYTIADGMPAKVLKYRFAEEEIVCHEELLDKNNAN